MTHQEHFDNVALLLAQHRAALNVLFCGHESGNVPENDISDYISMLVRQSEHIETALSDALSTMTQGERVGTDQDVR